MTRCLSTALLLGTVSLVSVSASAQVETSDPTAVDPADQVNQPVAPAAVAGQQAADVIVITAQGREQQLSDVPIAVSAVSAEQLQNSGANDIRELNQLAPSLLVSSTGTEANGSARVRGIGTVGDNPGLESSVAVFIDGVYRSRSGAGLNEIGPIERVEVLRGPQGTLFGRNASAGLINIVTQGPEFDTFGYGTGTYGNYDFVRLEGGFNTAVSDTVAARIDGVYSRRDGFYNDVNNDTDVNDRDRYLVRAQALFEPTSDLSFRLIGDYSKKDEACCAAVFLTPEVSPFARIPLSGDAFDPQGYGDALVSEANPIIPVLLSLGQDPRAFTDDPYDRNIYTTPGRTYEGETEDWGVSLQADWDLGWGEITSITGYREYLNQQGSDTDYTQVDILYREPGADALSRKFETFSQELRLQGSILDDRLDWLVGGYYANEDLTVRENLKFGSDYGRFAACRLNVSVGLQAFYDENSVGCISPTGQAVIGGQVPGVPSPFGAAGPLILQNLALLDSVRNVGSDGSRYMQNSENFAFFTHNIFHVTDTVDLTVGLRYTNETKTFSADLNNTNTICPQVRENLSPLLAGPLGALAGGIISLSCQGNSTSELNGLVLDDERSEEELTGTAVLSWKPSRETLIYGSYSRGYKAGGFNLDRSALNGQGGNAVVAGPLVLADTANLQFDQEEVDAFEIGAKYDTRAFSLSAAIFRQEFSNFQLNTFNGTVYLVQNVNGCSDLDGGDGADTDTSAATGSCVGDIEPGVISQGFELEASLRPANYLAVTTGLTYAATEYADNLVGSDQGVPLDPALRLLPGDNLSNAPELVMTGSLSWTPPIGDTGMSGLFYINTRVTGDYNTGSDLLAAKEQDGYVVVNGRIGIRGEDERWAIEGWVQNMFDEEYTQVGFNTPFIAPNQTYSAFLAEPRTYGVTLRGRF
ncbi:TonB-dependent receptor [Pacificimonas flava]|uniref:TonB-dependent receptor n=2 Tax=Pacificimonas TaxID=1960290 RepID=A0A219B0J4_9SPHN|nr:MULTISPECIES: TonB-dependent receptor [Pacificimonas]MBZ6379693.1 TonB-dependent receptor [Pacificimonas aurantium]OWV31845.1 TonB-dependent receptor [Pacificimonas flava]